MRNTLTTRGFVIPFSALGGAVVAALVFAIGFMVFRVVEHQKTGTENLSDSPGKFQEFRRGTDSSRQSSVQELISIPVLTSLEDLRDIKSELLRRAAVRRLIYPKSYSDLTALLDDSKELPSAYLRELVQVEVFRKLALLEPSKAYALATETTPYSRGRILEVVFSEWSLSNLDQLISHVSSIDKNQAKIALEVIWRTRNDLSQSVLAEIANKLGLSETLFAVHEKVAVESSFINPQQTWASLLGDEWNDRVQLNSLVAVAETWIRKEGWDVFGHIAESVTEGETKRLLLSRLLRKLARDDASTAFEYSLRYKDELEEVVLSSVVSDWARIDPDAAMRELLEYETTYSDPDPINWGWLFYGWASVDAHGLMERVPGLPIDQQSKAREYAISEIARTSPQQAMNFVADAPQKLPDYLVQDVARAWAQLNVDDALNWVLGNSNLNAQKDIAIRAILFELALDSPERAMQIALKQPTGESIEAALVISLAERGHTDSALSMTPHIRDGSNKIRAYVTVGSSLIRNGQFRTAFGLAESLSESESDYFFRQLVSHCSLNDPQGLFKSLNNITSSKIKQLAVEKLMQNRKSLHEEQVVTLELML